MTTSAAKVLPSGRLSLKDRLSRLTFSEACALLGPEGRQLIQRHANTWEFRLREDVFLGPDLFRLRFPDDSVDGEPLVVTITLMAEVRNRLHFRCNRCRRACEHVGAAFSLILEEKLALGLAAPPKPRQPIESLAEDELLRRALAERAERARIEKMSVKTIDATRPWTDYLVTNRLSGKTYRVALRGTEPGDSYCSCPDFRTNTLGTCKHVLHVLAKVKRRLAPRQLSRPFRPKCLAIHLRYAGEVSLRLLVPDAIDEEAAKIVSPLRDRAIEDLRDLLKRMARLQRLGQDVTIYPDAEEFIQQRTLQERLSAAVGDIRKNPAAHPLRTTLLKLPLLPYQLDGIAFAAGACRAILADDMGLGKTMQGVGTAELLAREAEIRKVLIICPASLKSQWRGEIQRFCDRDVQLIHGAAAERQEKYGNDCFFTVCNYEQVLRDILAIERNPWDLIILDEGQRIKNWEAKTSRVVKSLRSRFALVLSGTPLENRLDDLYSIVQFVDDRRLGPGFRFFNKHRVVDEKGKVLGYKNLGELREMLKPILLRRTRESVRLELPERTTEFVRIAPSAEQLEMHRSHMQIVATIVRKKFISEMDLLRLQKELLVCRMTANGTFLVDKQKPSYSTKLERLDELLESLFDEEGRKVVLFSEWTTMLDLIEPLLRKRKLDFVRLDGSVPQKKRQELVHRFQTDAGCRLFLTTNAGSTGLNLQAANTVINVDLPWNPAVLEQRIARAHRMGQRQSVQVFVLVTEGTIEESLLATIAAKKDLALAALDVESDVDAVDVASGMQELKGRLEVLLGARCEAPVDQSVRQQEKDMAERLAQSQRDRVAAAGGELLGAAFKLLGELVEQTPTSPPPLELVTSLRDGLGACVDEDQAGKPRLTVTLPDRDALDQLAQTLARLLVASQGAMGSARSNLN
ncbi:MAG: DEAD/DEAH box helicase [Planctomycetia bacterium]|nr:DEAD/DEAH box helicase [Planctomycetia bacterium]